MKDANTIVREIKERFTARTQEKIPDGSIMDLYIRAIGEELKNVYQEIEDNKTPHIWTKLKGKTLDDTGTWINCPRKPGESDESYKYRLMGWLLSTEASNTSAITLALLKPQHAANIDYIPKTRGCGTGTCYVVPKNYTAENIAESLEEAHKIIDRVASAGTDIDFIVPEMKPVSLEIYIKTSHGDDKLIKEKITQEIKEYINQIPPGDYLKLGLINMMGVNTKNVEYFNVISLIIDQNHVSQIDTLQGLKSKFIFDDIRWIEDNGNA